MAAEKTVKAGKPGFYQGPRAVGDVFQVPATLNGTWFKEVVSAPSATPAAKKATALNGEDLA